MEYQIVYARNILDLTDSVKSLLLEGWRPLGGVSVAFDGSLVFHQALTRASAAESLTASYSLASEVAK
jgi:hypothetical protein